MNKLKKKKKWKAKEKRIRFYGRTNVVCLSRVTALLWQRGSCNSMKLWAMSCRVIQGGRVIGGVLTKRHPLEEGMANHPSKLAMRTSWPDRKIWHQKMSSPGWKVSNMLLGKSGGQLLMAPERMQRPGQNGNDAQLWMRLVMKVKPDAAKNSIS